MRCQAHGMFDPTETQTKECPQCLEAQRDRFKEALEQIAGVGLFDAFDSRTPREVAKDALQIA